jgi:hypothetical protein
MQFPSKAASAASEREQAESVSRQLGKSSEHLSKVEAVQNSSSSGLAEGKGRALQRLREVGSATFHLGFNSTRLQLSGKRADIALQLVLLPPADDQPLRASAQAELTLVS